MALAPHHLRLLRSAQVALPVTNAFWEDLARGLATTPEHLAKDIRRLCEEGMIQGIWGEPNPAPSGAYESIVADPSGIEHHAVRWRSAGAASVFSERKLREGWLSTQWLKVGTLPDWSTENAEQLLLPSTDRTTLAREDDSAPPPPMTPEQRAVFKAFTQPILPNPPETPWTWLAAQTGLPEDTARRAVAGLLIARYWRRFALKLNLGASGWNGCGLAAWDIDPEQASHAARALATIRGTGDVCLRQPSAEHPFNVSALILARAAGEGEEVARRISTQWNRPLGRWMNLLL